MKKILIVACNDLGNGGIQHVIMDIVRNLSDKFHFDILLFSNEESYFEPEFKKYGKVFRLPHYEGRYKILRKIDKYIRFFRIYKGVKKILKENGPYNVIHCHNYFEAAPCLMAAKHCGVPIRISHGHDIFLKSHCIAEIYRKFYRYSINRYASCKIACSQGAADYLFGKNRGGISVSNAIDLKKFDMQLYLISKLKHSFIHVASFGEKKNQLFILDVFKIIQEHWTDATLKLIGNKNEEYEQKLRNKIAVLNLHNVEFLPHYSDIPTLFAQSEYMIFPSLFEGFGLALAEAQAMGVKCFASDVIPKESDIGLCHYLSLKQPAQEWAQEIFNSEKEPIKKPDISKVNLSNFLNKIYDCYERIK